MHKMNRILPLLIAFASYTLVGHAQLSSYFRLPTKLNGIRISTATPLAGGSKLIVGSMASFGLVDSILAMRLGSNDEQVWGKKFSLKYTTFNRGIPSAAGDVFMIGGSTSSQVGGGISAEKAIFLRIRANGSIDSLRYFKTSDNNNWTDIAPSDTSFFVAGNMGTYNGFSYAFEPVISKITRSGKLSLTSKINVGGTSTTFSSPKLESLPDNGVIVAFQRTIIGIRRFFFMRLSANGTIVWSKNAALSENQSTTMFIRVRSIGNNEFVALARNQKNIANTPIDMYLFKFNGDGAMLGCAKIGLPSFAEEPHDLLTLSDGNMMILGKRAMSTGGNRGDFAIVVSPALTVVGAKFFPYKHLQSFNGISGFQETNGNIFLASTYSCDQPQFEYPYLARINPASLSICPSLDSAYAVTDSAFTLNLVSTTGVTLAPITLTRSKLKLEESDVSGVSTYQLCQGCPNVQTGILPSSTPVQSLSVFPNPGQGSVFIRTPTETPGRLTIWNGQGAEIQTIELGAGKSEHQVDLRNLPAGPYLFFFQSADYVAKSVFIRE